MQCCEFMDGNERIIAEVNLQKRRWNFSDSNIIPKLSETVILAKQFNFWTDLR